MNSLADAQRRAELNATLATHPAFAAHAEQTRAAADKRVAEAERAIEQATTTTERTACESELKSARIARGRVIGLPCADDPQFRFAGSAMVIVGGGDPTQSDWFQKQVAEQERQIPKTPTLQQQLQSGAIKSGPPAGAIFVGERSSWVTDWRGR
jgi:anti-sigma factor RsiW